MTTYLTPAKKTSPAWLCLPAVSIGAYFLLSQSSGASEFDNVEIDKYGLLDEKIDSLEQKLDSDKKKRNLDLKLELEKLSKNYGEFREEDHYRLAYIDDTIPNPLAIDQNLATLGFTYRKQDDELKRAKSIFDFILKNIKYNHGKRRSYQNAISTFYNKKGVCGELSFLYTALARRAGLKAGFSEVSVDNDGKKVVHASSWVKANGRKIYVDPAYKTFDIRHGAVNDLSDSEAVKKYLIWRN